MPTHFKPGFSKYIQTKHLGVSTKLNPATAIPFVGARVRGPAKDVDTVSGNQCVLAQNASADQVLVVSCLHLNEILLIVGVPVLVVSHGRSWPKTMLDLKEKLWASFTTPWPSY